MVVGHEGENLSGELFGEEHGALGLATAAEASSGPATEGEKVLGRPERAGVRLEALLVGPDVAVEMVLKQLINRSLFGMPGPIRSRRITKQKRGMRRGGMVGPSSRSFQQTACESFEPRFCTQPRARSSSAEAA